MFERHVIRFTIKEDDLAEFMHTVGRYGFTYRIRKVEYDPGTIYIGGYKPEYRVHVYAPWWAYRKFERFFCETFEYEKTFGW